MINAINIALGGLNAASAKVDKAAAAIATQGPDAEQAVNLTLGGIDFKANAAVIRTAQKMDDDLFHAFDQKV